MKPTPRDVRWIAERLDGLSRDVQNLQNRKPGLAYSSIEDGAIREYDKDGVLGSQTGKQPDGTHGNVVLNGPKPPKPTDPDVTAVPGMLEGRWNGKFAGDVVSPLDLKHVAMYAVLAGEVLDLSKQAGVMTGELGDNVQVQVDPGVYNVYLVSWSKAGRFSDAAGPVPVLVPVAADMDAIQDALDDLDLRYDGVITEAGTLGARLDTAETDLVAHDDRLSINDGKLETLTGTTLPALDAKLDQAKADLAPLPGMIADNKTKVDAAKTRLDSLDSTTLPALSSDLTAAKNRLTAAENTLAPLPAKVATAQSDLTAAFGQLGTVDSRVATAKAAAQTAAAADATAKAEAAEARAAAAAALDAKSKADAAQVAALAAAKTYADAQASGASSDALAAAKADATAKADAAKAAAIAAAALDATAKKEQAEATAAADAKAKADAALAAAKADATSKSDAAKQAAITAAAADATAKAEAAEARAAAAAALDAKSKADAAQVAALAAAKTYADAQASGASSDALAAAKADATAKADAAKAAAIAAAALDATAKKEQAEATAAADAKAKADAALAAAKADATSKSDAAKQAAITAAAADAQSKADAALATANAQIAQVVAKGQNLVSNGDFEAGQDGWQVLYSGFSAVETGESRSTSKAMRIGPNPGGNVWPLSLGWVPSSDGRTYYLEMWVRRTGDESKVAGVGFVVQYRTTTTTTTITGGRVDSLSISDTGWTKVTTTYTIPVSDATHVHFAPWIVAGNNVYRVDDFLAVDVTEAKEALDKAAAAQFDASAALAKAGAAKDTADAALTMAGSKSVVYYSTSAPSGTASPGDVWRRIDASTNVIAEWFWDTAWRASQITNEMISNLDVGKLTAGAAVVDSAVINKLAVQIATVIQLNADRITAGKVTSGQIDTPNLAASLATILKLNASAITAGTIAAARLDVADLSARIATIISLNADRITAGTVNTARLNVTDIAAQVATVIKLNAETIIAGTIATARLDVVDIAAKTAAFQQVDVKNLFATTGTISELVAKKIWADLAIFNKVTTGMLAIGAFDNLVVDPDFTDTALRAQRIAASSATVTAFGTSADNGRAHIIIPASTGQLIFKMIATEPGRGTPVAPGATYRIRYQARTASGTAGTRPAVTCRKADGTSAFTAVDSGAYVTVGTSWQWVDYTWTAPDDAAAAFFDVQRQAGLTGILWARTPQVTRMNAGELVVDGSIKAAHADLVSFAANTGFIADLTARIVKADMFVGKEFHGGIFTGSTFQTNVLPNIGLKLDQNGFRAYGPEGGEPVAEIRPDGGTVYSVSDPATGQVLAAMDSAGGIAGQSLGISGDAQFDGVLIAGGEPLTPSHLGTESPGDVGPIFNGRSLLGSTFTNFFEQHPSTADGTSWLTALPQGVISNAWREHVGALTFSGLGGQEHLRILMTSTAQLVTGRAYSITFRTPAFKQIDTLNAGTVGYATVRRSDPGGSVTPGGAGGTVAGTLYYYPAGGGAQAISGTTYIRCPEDIPAGKVMFAIQVACYPGLKMESIDSGNSNRWELVVADMGLRTVDNAGRVVNLGKQGAAAPPPAPAPDPDPIRQYTDTISPSWWKAYKGNNDDNTPTFNGKVTQGYSGYAPSNGVMRGMIGFPSQASRLSGATVKKIEVYVYAEHWHASAGGTLCIGVHTATAQPSVWSSSADDVKRQKMKKPEGRWITLPPSVHNGFKSGSNRGITLLPPGSSTSSEYYGYLVGSKTRLRVTYTK